MSDLIPKIYIDAIAKAKRYAEIFYETRLLEEIYSSEDGKIIYVTLSVRPQMGCDESKKVFMIASEDMSLIGIRDYKWKEVFYDWFIRIWHWWFVVWD